VPGQDHIDRQDLRPDGDYAVRPGWGSTDNCAVDSLALSQYTFTCANVGDNPVTLTVKDSSGNTGTCVAHVTVLSCNHAPEAVCKPNPSVTLDAAGTATITAADVDGGSSDPDGEADIASITVSPTSASCSDVASGVAVTLTITDKSGESDTCQVTVAVVDTTPPEITCPANIRQNADAGECEADVTFAATATDNCSYTLAYDIGGTPITSAYAFPVGTTRVRAVATDPAGLTDECTFDVTVVDDQAPEITCPANIRQNADAGECEADVTFAATATDNCSYTLAYDIGGTPITSAHAFPVGTTRVRAGGDRSGGTDGRVHV